MIMKRVLLAAVVAGVLMTGGISVRGAEEPVGISLLRIEMKKALLQQEQAPKLTALRQKKLQELQMKGKAEEALDAEVDLIQSQAAESVGNINLKQLDLQLKEAIKMTSMPPGGGAMGGGAPTASPPPGVAGTGGSAPTGNQPQGSPQGQGEPPATEMELAMLELDVQKAKVQSETAAKISANREKLHAERQKKNEGVTDSEAELLAAQTSARVAALDVEAAQMRLDAAKKTVAPRK
jgi:hypothetical protein